MALPTGLCGGSASGKTTVARKIIEALDVPWVVLLSMDSFYKVRCVMALYSLKASIVACIHTVISQPECLIPSHILPPQGHGGKYKPVTCESPSLNYHQVAQRDMFQNAWKCDMEIK